jgi:hypothetical protein
MAINKILFPIFCSCCIIFIPRCSRGAFDFIGVGAEALSLGNAMVASRSNSYAVYYNPANISFNQRSLVEAGYRSFFGLASPVQTNLLINYTICAYPFSCCCIHLGNKIYREIHLILGSSFSFLEKISMGMSMNLYSLNIAGYSGHLAAGINIGFSYLLHDQISMGVLITNLNQPKFGIIDEKLPQIFTVGWCYSPNKIISFCYELFRDVKYEQDFRAGVSFTCTPELMVRLGLENDSNTYSLGFGLIINKLKFNYAAVWHTVLGLSHVTSVQVSL